MVSREPFELSREEIEAEVEAYRKARVARLTSEKGWLSLVGKFWLTPGPNRMGSASDASILLPADRAPGAVGTVTLENGVVRLDAAPSVELYARGSRLTSLVLRSDAEPEPDEVRLGSLFVELIRRGDDLAIRVRDSKSRARESFSGLSVYPVDPAWRITAQFVPFEREREVILDDSDGRPQPYASPGAATFERDGVTSQLVPVFESAARKRLFVLFADATNRDATYGAGRFLYAPLPEDGRILLDFNKAFNPPCAFTPYAACPLPSSENRLAQRVEAGEKRPAELGA